MVNSAPHYDVVIVGYGPVGAVAANLLGREGLTVAVFERTASVYHLPRASQFDDEVMRIFQSAGLADDVEAVTAPIAGTEVVTPSGEVLLSVTEQDAPGTQGWSRGYAFWQPDLEAVLRSGVERFDRVDVHLEHEVERVTPQDDGSSVVDVRDLNNGRARRVRATWTLGCDGARSSCRGRAGIDLDDLGFHQLWLVVDAALLRPVDLPRVVRQVCDPVRSSMFFPSTGNHVRWEFEIRAGESPADVARPERIGELVAPWVDPADIELVRAVVYAFNSLVARRWRERNLLLLGDSAHQIPRFLAQGMGAGIRDAANVAWKLGLVCRGGADTRLLDTYQAEREPHVRTVTKLSADFGRFLRTGPDREGGAPCAVDLAIPPLVTGVLHRGSAAGTALPQPRVRTATGTVRLDEVLGRSFAVLSRHDPRELISERSLRLWDSLGTGYVQVRPGGEPHRNGGLDVVVDDVEAALAGLLGDDRLVVVRPDRYVYGTTDAWVGADAITATLAADLGRAVAP